MRNIQFSLNYIVCRLLSSQTKTKIVILLFIMKKAIITGATGQDGANLAEFLLHKGYEVHGIKRRSSLFNTQRIDHLYKDHHLSDG